MNEAVNEETPKVKTTPGVKKYWKQSLWLMVWYFALFAVLATIYISQGWTELVEIAKWEFIGLFFLIYVATQLYKGYGLLKGLGGFLLVKVLGGTLIAFTWTGLQIGLGM